jgi:hypothetical protein
MEERKQRIPSLNDTGNKSLRSESYTKHLSPQIPPNTSVLLVCSERSQISIIDVVVTISTLYYFSSKYEQRAVL